MKRDHIVDTGNEGVILKMSDDVLKNALAGLKMYANVESSAIISNDGILITSDMDPKFHPESFAAMASVMRKTALITMQTIGNHSINKLIVENHDGSKVITVCAGPKAMITTMVNPDDNEDLNLMEINKAAATVKSYFD